MTCRRKRNALSLGLLGIFSKAKPQSVRQSIIGLAKFHFRNRLEQCLIAFRFGGQPVPRLSHLGEDLSGLRRGDLNLGVGGRFFVVTADGMGPISLYLMASSTLGSIGFPSQGNRGPKIDKGRSPKSGLELSDLATLLGTFRRLCGP